MKKSINSLKSSLILLFFALLWFGNAQSDDWFYDPNNNMVANPTTDIGDVIKTTNVNESNSLLNRLLDLFQLSNQSWYAQWTSKAFIYLKMIMNILLGLVSFISVILVIYAFYMMFFSEQEEATWKAMKILKWVAIAIAIIWLSWLIVSFFFDINTTISDGLS